MSFKLKRVVPTTKIIWCSPVITTSPDCITIALLQYCSIISLHAEFQFAILALNISVVKKHFFFNLESLFFLGPIRKLSTSKLESKLVAKCYYWKKLGEAYMGTLYCLL